MPNDLPRCEAVPIPNHEVAFRIDGRERLRWNYNSAYPRPFFYPLLAPNGGELTRMGHPGAPNHDHHQSIWFAHNKVLGIDFWSNTSPARIRQKQWLAYEDGDNEAMMGVLLAWHDGHDPRELLQQQLLVSVRPAPGAADETLLELDSTFTPVAEMLEFQQTNYGFLAVRVARSISAHFGGGQLTNDRSVEGEPQLFEQSSRWMDYSGPLRGAAPADDGSGGVTFFDHPDNPGYPVHWHVREDGWMGAAPTMQAPLLTTKAKPLRLRYLLHAHGGRYRAERAEEMAAWFTHQPPMRIASGRELKVKHRHSVLVRE
ncbi:MAG: PmoA family protein [Planctomycetales bacterium]|nr:PmoA family protein [Planctomycetales bacterium]